MEAAEYKVDRSGWAPGPWDGEPDRIEWRAHGLPCLMVRHETSGHWCGYAAVPPGHPAHGKHYDAVDAEVHGGLTYAELCAGHVCHVPHPGEPDNVWWLGFDCAHGHDAQPRVTMNAFRAILGDDPFTGVVGIRREYRTVEYVKHETERLAEQLAAMEE